MRKISSYMTKLGIVEGDEIIVNNIKYYVDENGYLHNEDNMLCIRETAEVLMGLEEYSVVINDITEHDYNILSILDTYGYKRVMFIGDGFGKCYCYATNLTTKKFYKLLSIRPELLTTAESIFVNRGKRNSEIKGVPFELNSFGQCMVMGQLYSVKFLLKRYKNRVCDYKGKTRY